MYAVHMPPLEGRLVQLWLYGRSHPDDNHYAHPIDIVVLVDLNLKKVPPTSLSADLRLACAALKTSGSRRCLNPQPCCSCFLLIKSAGCVMQQQQG